MIDHSKNDEMSYPRNNDHFGAENSNFFLQDDSWLLSCFHFVIFFHFSFFFHFSPKKHNGDSSSKLFTFKSPLRPCSNFIFKKFHRVCHNLFLYLSIFRGFFRVFEFCSKFSSIFDEIVWPIFAHLRRRQFFEILQVWTIYWKMFIELVC